MPVTPQDVLLIVIVPALLVLFLAGISWQVWRTGYARGWWGGPLAIAIGFGFAFTRATESMPHWPPHEATSWIFFIAVLAGVFGLIDALVRWPTWVRVVMAFVVNAVSLAAVLKFKYDDPDISHGKWFAMISSMTIIGVLWWIAFELSTLDDTRGHLRAGPGDADGFNPATAAKPTNAGPLDYQRVGGVVAKRSSVRTISTPLLMWLVATASTLAFFNGGIKFGKLAMCMAGIAGGLAVVSLIRPNVRWSRGVMFAFCPVMLSTIAAAHYIIPFQRLEAVKFTFPLLAVPVFIAIGRMVAIPIPSPRWRTTVRIVALALPMLLVMALAGKQLKEAMSNEGAEEDPYKSYGMTLPQPVTPLGTNRPILPSYSDAPALAVWR